MWTGEETGKEGKQRSRRKGQNEEGKENKDTGKGQYKDANTDHSHGYRAGG